MLYSSVTKFEESFSADQIRIIMELYRLVSETEIKQTEMVTLIGPHLDIDDTPCHRNKSHHDSASSGNFMLLITANLHNSAIKTLIK
jgi:hypothetical protein